MAVLDKEFNRAVLDIAGYLLPQGFDVCLLAPSTYRELKEHFACTGRLVVYAGASEQAIYGDASVNHTFRAWHDICHLHGGYDTSFVGEVQTCSLQTHQLLQRYGDSSRTARWQKIVEAEIVGQARYFERNGCFPVDQATFVRTYLHDPAAALRATY